MFSTKYIILFTLFAGNLIDVPTPLVKVEQGLMSGKINSDGKLYQFMGIPYASSVGRFQAPLPPTPWEGVYKAVLDHYHCPQYMEIGYIGTEDCLRLNVYVPSKAKKPLPVMVYIHGGAFTFGSGGRMLAGPEFLVKHDVILVTVNYRLGALGFLCLGIEEAPGNAGLKDQIAALRWVKRNIAAFGGDPDNVTLFGESAGSISTSLLLASDATHGLFHKAISQSGTSLGFMSSTDGIKIASSVAKHFGYNSENPKELFDIFSKIPTKDLVSYASPSLEPLLKIVRNNLLFHPCIEQKFPGIEPVYTEIPKDIIEKRTKNIPVIYGFTNNEGFFLTVHETEESIRDYNSSLFQFFDFEFPSEKEAKAVEKRVRQFYFGDKDVSVETKDNLNELYGDYFFDVPTILESEVVASKSEAPIYNYHFSYAGGRNLIKAIYSGSLSGPGASHADDLLYLFTSFLWPFPINERDQRVIDWMTKMWTNFAKYGDPTPAFDKELPVKWISSTKTTFNFLNIDENLSMGPLPDPERYKLWQDLYTRYRKKLLNK